MIRATRTVRRSEKKGEQNNVGDLVKVSAQGDAIDLGGVDGIRKTTTSCTRLAAEPDEQNQRDEQNVEHTLCRREWPFVGSVRATSRSCRDQSRGLVVVVVVVHGYEALAALDKLSAFRAIAMLGF